MADEPKKDKSDLDKTLSPSDGVSDPDKAREDELNATMMAIDVSKLNLGDTKTDIKIEIPKAPTDDEIIREQLEEKKSPLARLFGQLFVRKKKAQLRHVNLPRVLEPYLHFWICDPNESLLFQIFFYVLRLVIIGLTLACQSLLGQQVFEAFAKLHPERLFFALIFGAEICLSLFFLLRKKSPGWLVAWPFAALALIMAYGAIFYHTADRDYFMLLDGSISEYLNGFYLLVFLYLGVVALFEVVRQFLWRSFMAFLFAGTWATFALNLFLKVRLEQSFFGPGFLGKIPLDSLQPLWLVFQVLTPLLFVLLAVYALKPGKSSLNVARCSMARSLTLLLFFMLVLNVALMQKNRVFHAFNFVLPQRLDVGGIEFRHLNQNLKIVTKNFVAHEGLDGKSRYRFHVRYAKKRKMFLLEVEDVFGFPVKNLSRADFLLTSDDKKIANAEITEDRTLDPAKGNYWVKLMLEPKSDVVKWRVERRQYLPREEISLELTQPDKLGRVVVKYEDEVLLEVKSPKDAKIALPLGYFRDGLFKLKVLAYDSLDQEIFQKDLDLSVASPKALSILFPRDGDVVGPELNVVTRLAGVPTASVKSVSYYFRDQLLGQFDGLAYFQSLDLSAAAEGPGVLKVVLDTGTEQFSQQLSLNRATPAASLSFTEPAMGVFAERDLPVSYTIAGTGVQVAGVKLFVNGHAFTDFRVKDQGFSLPVSRWQMSEIYVVLTATLSNGQSLSDWVQVNRGMSELELKFDPATLGFLNVSKVAVILDASVSSWDNWQNRSKWQSMSNVILAPDVENKLALLNPSFFVFGNEKPYYYYDCSDAHDLLEKRSYNKALLKRILERIKPGGVAALARAFELAYKSKPDMIFAFADSSDYCRANLMTALRKSAGQSPATRVFLISLGRVSKKDQKELIRLVEHTGGRYMQPEDYNALSKMLIEELVLNYELYSQDKLIAKLPLEDKSFHLGPGNYVLKIPYGATVQEIPLKLEHGTQTTLTISGKKIENQNKIHIQQSVQQI